MRFTLSILNGSLLNVEIDTEPDEDETVKPPFGFAGSGTGVIETSTEHDPLTDRPGDSEA